MCGVFGYIGHRAAKELVLEGLARLEHRGYDSAGLCLLGDGRLDVVRAVGKLAQLERRAAELASPATAGIGHTRWATHGRVTEANAHPLVAEDEVAIVLNGIIENHAALRAELEAGGAVMRSQTDAEVVAHLIRAAYRGDLVEAVRAACDRLAGHYALVAVHRDHPDLLAGARRRCPLLVGVGERETFVASSVAAFPPEVGQVLTLEDGDVAAVTSHDVRLLTADGTPRERDAVIVPDTARAADRGGFETYMLKEIAEQPRAVAETVWRTLDLAPLAAGRVGAADLGAVDRIVIVACGTAYHAGLVARYAIEDWAGIPCEVDTAGEWRHRRTPLGPNALVIGISQSGETADTLASLRAARRRGAATIAVTNSPGSQIAREVDGVLVTEAGVEVGVAATKTFTAQVALLAAFAARLAALRGSLDADALASIVAALRALPHQLLTCVEDRAAVDAVAERHHRAPFFLYLGRHVGLPVCLEGALKLKEISYIPTDAYAAGEMKHGPIALLDDGAPVVCVATEVALADKLAANLEEVRARGASVVAVVTDGCDAVRRVAGEVLEVPRTHPLLQPVLSVVPLQLLAYGIARRRGLDVDQPRNLAKTVTVE
jgi:glucosamine--fructose-6-phosphate aminotransferase (isomerizing)